MASKSAMEARTFNQDPAQNKVKKNELFRSQVFSTKNGQPSSVLIVNKEVDREEAMAGIALLNKHEQAMKRYQGAGKNSDYYSKKKMKPDWNAQTRSPSTDFQPRSLLNEHDSGYKLIQLK